MLEQDPAHELMALYARALNDVGAWLGERSNLVVRRLKGIPAVDRLDPDVEIAAAIADESTPPLIRIPVADGSSSRSRTAPASSVQSPSTISCLESSCGPRYRADQ